MRVTKHEKRPEKTNRAWQRMLSGRRLDLLNPSPFDIEIEDIAHGLARVARWNGQTSGNYPFSVAEHSVVVEKLFSTLNSKAPREDKLMALLHDAAEYVVGDMISPFKAALSSSMGIDYTDFENRIERAVHLRFGLPPHPRKSLKKTIKTCDIYCAYFEATQIAGFTVDEANELFTKPPGDIRIKIAPLSVVDAKKLYLKRFAELS